MSYLVSDFLYNDTIHDEKHHDMHITCMLNSLIINKLSKQIRDQLQYNIIPPKIYTHSILYNGSGQARSIHSSTPRLLSSYFLWS